MGCSNEHFDIGHYEHKRDVKLTKLKDFMPYVTVRVRSLQDPAVQALIMTDGTYDIGMDAGLKLLLSLLGILLSIGIFCYIIRSCVVESRKEQQLSRAQKFYM